MFTRDEIPDNDRLQQSITVTVVDVTRPDDDRRDAELLVRDGDGNELVMTIWSTHDVDQDWQVDHRYELANVRGKRYRKNGETQYELSSTGDLDVTDLGTESDSVTRVLLVGDTHVGYRHRPDSKKPRGAKRVDAREGFEEALAVAESSDAAAIVHAGDVFDHEATAVDAHFAGEQVEEFLRQDVPFYYVQGNHDPDDAMGELRNRATVTGSSLRLDDSPTTVEGGPVNLFGVDHQGGGKIRLAVEEDISTVLNSNVLVVHETPYPVVGEEGQLLYDPDGAIDLASLLDRCPVSFDLIVCGHMHVANRGVVRGHDVPVVVTGPTVPISKRPGESTACVWVLEIEEGTIRNVAGRSL